jgi:hypothetical protein
MNWKRVERKYYGSVGLLSRSSPGGTGENYVTNFHYHGCPGREMNQTRSECKLVAVLFQFTCVYLTTAAETVARRQETTGKT